MKDGFFVIDRGIFDHPAFANEPYSEREAWIWLVGSAAWRTTRIRTARGMTTLERGQLMHSERFLATKWMWSRSRVTRFLFRLETEHMASRQQDHETNRITICNYDEYQLGGAADRTEDKAETEPPPNRQRTKEEELNNLRTKNSSSAEGKSRKKPARPMPDIFPASDAMRAYAEKRGYKFEIPPCFAFNKARPGPAQAMFETFKNHHAAKGSTFADWDAAWRTWVDNQVRWDTERGKPPGLRPAI